MQFVDFEIIQSELVSAAENEYTSLEEMIRDNQFTEPSTRSPYYSFSAMCNRKTADGELFLTKCQKPVTSANAEECVGRKLPEDLTMSGYAHEFPTEKVAIGPSLIATCTSTGYFSIYSNNFAFTFSGENVREFSVFAVLLKESVYTMDVTTTTGKLYRWPRLTVPYDAGLWIGTKANHAHSIRSVQMAMNITASHSGGKHHIGIMALDIQKCTCL